MFTQFIDKCLLFGVGYGGSIYFTKTEKTWSAELSEWVNSPRTPYGYTAICFPVLAGKWLKQNVKDVKRNCKLGRIIRGALRQVGHHLRYSGIHTFGISFQQFQEALLQELHQIDCINNHILYSRCCVSIQNMVKTGLLFVYEPERFYLESQNVQVYLFFSRTVRCLLLSCARCIIMNELMVPVWYLSGICSEPDQDSMLGGGFGLGILPPRTRTRPIEEPVTPDTVLWLKDDFGDEQIDFGTWNRSHEMGYFDGK